MRAMILAAGRGERMRPLTDRCPKPLLPVGGKPLIEWHLEALAAAGIRQVVINHAHLGSMIEQSLGDGSRWKLDIRYSPESPALETAGGIAKALPALGKEPFLVLNGDVYCDFPLARAVSIGAQMRAGDLLAWCVLVRNPPHHPGGDFGLCSGWLQPDPPFDRACGPLTFSGIGVYRAELFDPINPGQAARLAPLLRAAAARRLCGAELHPGAWVDVGTPQRLAELDAELSKT